MFLGDFHSECGGEDHLPCVCRSYPFFSGWNSVVGVVPWCGLDGLRIISHWQDLVYMSRPLLGPNQPCTMGTRFLSWGKVAGVWHWPPTQSGTNVKEKVDLYFHFPSGPWPVIGWTDLFIPVCQFLPCLLLHLPCFMWVVNVRNSWHLP
jgi:hypothetical protein